MKESLPVPCHTWRWQDSHGSNAGSATSSAGNDRLGTLFSPSIIVSSDFQQALEAHTSSRMDGRLGSKGQSLTYQSMLNLWDTFWRLLQTHRVLVILMKFITALATTLRMPMPGAKPSFNISRARGLYHCLNRHTWRSDRIPIALSNYCQHNKIRCDFVYGMAQAIQENVCRAPASHWWTMTASSLNVVIKPRNIRPSLSCSNCRIAPPSN